MLLLPFSCGKAFGPSRFPRESHSFCGQQLCERFIHWITLQRGGCHWLIGVVCATVIG